MQDRYAGDIGNYVKLAMLRRLSAGHKLGVLWWFYPDESHNTDGKHVAYLQDPVRWRRHDPDLFDALRVLVTAGTRHVASLEAANVLPNTKFYRAALPTAGSSTDRRSSRATWFQGAMQAVEGCDVVFLDPDNGLETANYNFGRAKAGKSVAISELEALRRPRSIDHRLSPSDTHGGRSHL